MHLMNITAAARRRLLITTLAATVFAASGCSADPASESTDTTAGASAPTTTDPVVTTSTPPSTTSAVPRPTATVDQLVGPDGQRAHVRCVGEGDTTVVLVSGFEADSSSWALVEPTIAEHARVCSYDRPGTGTSDPATATTNFVTQATDLHALLATIGEPGPYLLVGHSFGGAESVTFASLFPDEVAGIVLVDATPIAWPTQVCTANDGTDTAAMLRGFCSGMYLPTGNIEHLDALTAFAEVASIDSFGSLPMAVITAAERALPGLGAAETARLTGVWDDGQRDWAALSTNSHVVTVVDTSHQIEIDQPRIVIDEILGVLAES